MFTIKLTSTLSDTAENRLRCAAQNKYHFKVGMINVWALLNQFSHLVLFYLPSHTMVKLAIYQIYKVQLSILHQTFSKIDIFFLKHKWKSTAH